MCCFVDSFICLGHCQVQFLGVESAHISRASGAGTFGRGSEYTMAMLLRCCCNRYGAIVVSVQVPSAMGIALTMIATEMLRSD